MSGSASSTTSRPFSPDRRPTYSATGCSGAAPISFFQAGSRRAGWNNSVSTPNGTTAVRGTPRPARLSSLAATARSKPRCAARRVEPRVLVHEGDQACTRAARRPPREPRREIRAPYLDHIGLLARHDVAELPPRHQEVIARARGYGGTAHQVHARALPLRHGCLVRGNHDHVLDGVPGRQPARLRSAVGPH